MENKSILERWKDIEKGTFQEVNKDDETETKKRIEEDDDESYLIDPTYSIKSDKKKMDSWKEEYRKMRVDGRSILNEVKNNPINTEGIEITSFDTEEEYKMSVKNRQ